MRWFRDDIGNLEHLIVLINEECGILKQSLMKGSLLEMLTKKKSQVFYQPVDIQSLTNAIGKSVSSRSILNIVNQLDKYDFSCGLVVNNLKEQHLFSDQMNRNCFDLILARCFWNFSTMRNVRFINTAANEII